MTGAGLETGDHESQATHGYSPHNLRADVPLALNRRHRQVPLPGGDDRGPRRLGRRDGDSGRPARAVAGPADGRGAAGDPRVHRHRPLHAAAQHGRLLHGGRRDPHGAARPRGGALGVGEAGSDRRRTDALSRQRGARGSDHRPGEGRLHSPSLHERRSGHLPQAGGRRRRRRNAARRADRLRPGDPEPEQHPDHPGVRVCPGDRRRRRRHRLGRHAWRWNWASTVS